MTSQMSQESLVLLTRYGLKKWQKPTTGFGPLTSFPSQLSGNKKTSLWQHKNGILGHHVSGRKCLFIVPSLSDWFPRAFLRGSAHFSIRAERSRFQLCVLQCVLQLLSLAISRKRPETTRGRAGVAVLQSNSTQAIPSVPSYSLERCHRH